MKAWIATSAERRLIPTGGVRGPVPLLIAIMMFVMVIIAAAGLALGNVAGTLRGGVEHRYSIQLADGQNRAEAALAAARRLPGASRVQQVPPRELRQTLERWLGPSSAEADLPLPLIIDVDLSPGTDAGAAARSIEASVPGARLVAHGTSLAPLLDALTGLMLLTVGLVLLCALATAAAVVLAARGALDTHRATIEVMHGVGATDEQVARLFQRQIAIDALLGGTTGALLAAAVLAAVIGSAALATTLSGAPPLGWTDALLLAAFPLLGALLATLVARRAVLGALRGRL